MAKKAAADPKGSFPNDKSKGQVLEEFYADKKSDLSGKKLKTIWEETSDEIQKLYKSAKWEYVEANVKQYVRTALIKLNIFVPTTRDGKTAKRKVETKTVSPTQAIESLTQLKAGGLDLDAIKKAMAAIESHNQKHPANAQTIENVVSMLGVVETARQAIDEQAKKLAGLGF